MTANETGRPDTSDMDYDIDERYDEFCTTVPGPLQDLARSLAHRLGLVPRASIPWSETFAHRVTLTAPSLVTQGLPTVDPRHREMATTAHMLAVIEAFGTDRISDGQVADTPELRHVLRLAREYGERLLRRIGGTVAVAEAAAANRRTLEAIARERTMLTNRVPTTMRTYQAVAAGKQAVGLPATVTLVRTLGDSERVATVERLLMATWLGLQFHDDVADWEDDVAHGGAWAILLARSRVALEDSADPLSLRAAVHRSGVLADMMRASAAQFSEARDAAARLGARDLCGWASIREAAAREAQEGERSSPGYVNRVRLLTPWLSEVLG